MDFEDFIIAKMRGFPDEPGRYLEKFRQKLNAVILKCLVYRLKDYNKQKHEAKIFNYKYMN
jgi:hypothetical protein